MFKVGDRVVSEEFGEGTVIEIKDSSLSFPVVVQMDANNDA